MNQRERLVELGLAVVMFLIAALVYVIEDSNVGIAILGIAVVQFVRVRRFEGWAIEEMLIGGWLVILGVMTLIAPEWGIPLLLITGGVQLIRALGEVGVIVDLSLVAWLAYSRDAPLWTVALLLLVAAGKLFFLLREYASRRDNERLPAT